MEVSSSLQHIVKTSKDFTYYFYLDNNRVIHYDFFDSNNEFIRRKQLDTEPVIDFSVNIDTDDKIHLVSISGIGQLIYYIHYKKKWSNKILSILDIKSNTYKNLNILINNSYSHILCNKTNLLNTMITTIEHMYWNDKDIKKSTVTTYLPGKYQSPYQVAVDKNNCIHLLYKAYHKTNHQLYYCKFNLYNNRWSSGELISNTKDDHSHPHMLIDNNNNLHVVFNTIEDNNFALKYRRKTNIVSNKSKWSEIMDLSNKNANHLAPVLIQDDLMLKVLSKQNNVISEITSRDSGITWSASSKPKLYKIENPILLRYATNNPYEKQAYSLSHLYGFIDNHIKIIGAEIFKEMDDETTNQQKFEEVEVKKTSSAEPKPLIHNSESNHMYQVHKQPIASEDFIATKGVGLDIDLHELVNEIQTYLNRIIPEITKLEEAKKSLEINSKALDPNLNPLDLCTQLHSDLTQLTKEISKFEYEQLGLHSKLDDYQQKLYRLDEKIVKFKKQAMELEDRIMNIWEDSNGFVNRVKNLFR
ncbi:hypothetical protein [Alkaliphilus peptidifermentans]|uniref:BNR repeat-containing family member n=1 Tax=Alkaliphilus peptidifermentans DSM 18978 TaxID=1120976 RepID=A0A1G5H2B5_9FIRM|nr:hypothetical protein [Alkaliphilus peptidifermentans]SCY58022.1 hypothetical protein SAMN03080606_01888 [Alkaliphilus peptidifermentans DSM 18978]